MTTSTVTIENKEYKVLEVSPASNYPALQAEYPNVVEFLTIEGKRGALFMAVRKANGIFIS
jgi:hypothetical protein